VDFPALLTNLGPWIADSESLVRQHEVQFEELKTSYDEYHKQVGAAIKEIGAYMSHHPPFDTASRQSFDLIFDEGIPMLSEQKVERFSWLRPAVSRMQTWLQRAEELLGPARDTYAAFENQNRLVEELLQQTEAELNRSRSEIDSNWGWSRSETLPKIDSLARAFTREKNYWERLRERNWAEWDIHQAVATSGKLITFCEEILLDLARTLETNNPRQDELAGKTEAVMHLLDQNGGSLSTSDRLDIRSLLGMARETPDYEFANRLLEYAETMALNRVNPSTRNEITTLLQGYPGNGNAPTDRNRR
jgi:hypothetical protein